MEIAHEVEPDYSRTFLARLVEQLPQYIFWKDVNSVYLGCNRRYAELVGLTNPADIRGQSDYDLQWQRAGDSAELFRERDKVALEGKPILNVEQKLALSDGSIIEVLLSKEAIRDDAGTILGVMGVATDITEHNRLRVVEHKAQEADAIAKTMRMLAGTMAHELRTPLASLSLASTGIKQVLPDLLANHALAEQQGLAVKPISSRKIDALHKALDAMTREVNVAVTFIDMLLTSINTSAIDRRLFETCSIAEDVEEALQRYPFQEGQRELVTVSLEHTFSYHGQSLLFIHIVFNLIKNALHYIESKGEGDISIETYFDGTHNILNFTDTAQGIPASMLDKIFNPFVSYRREGTGVGLAFCQQVMQAFGGDIRCESESDKFTTFLLIFPKIK